MTAIDERQQLHLLRRTFFGRFLENDLLSRDVPQAQMVIWGLAFVLVPGIIYPVRMAGKFARLYYINRPNLEPLERAAWADKLFFAVFAMMVVGGVTLVAGEALFIDRRDATVLSPLPVRARTIIAAKLLALFQLLLLFGVGINLLPALLYSAAVGQYVGGVLPSFAAHVVSMGLAGAFACFALLGLQALLLLTLGERWQQRIAMALQLVVLLILLEMLFFLPVIIGIFNRSMAAGWAQDSWILWLPPAWFLGLYETMIGSTRPEMRELAWLAVGASAVTVSLTLGGYILGYRRHMQRMLETPGARGPATGRAGLTPGGAGLRAGETLVRLILPHPVVRAIAAFVMKSLARSRTHRIYFAMYIGLGAAIAAPPLISVLGRRGVAALAAPHVAVLSIPLAVAFFVILGLRALLAVPIDLQANWTVRFCEPADRGACLAGVHRAMVLVAVVPIALIAVVSAWSLWGAGVGLAHGLFVTMMLLLLVELTLARCAKIPFTCSYVSGMSNMKARWPAYLIAFSVFTQGGASLEKNYLLTSPAVFAGWSAAFVVVLAVLAFLRRRRAAEGFEFVYEEIPDQMQELIGFEGKFRGLTPQKLPTDYAEITHPQIAQITQIGLRR